MRKIIVLIVVMVVWIVSAADSASGQYITQFSKVVQPPLPTSLSFAGEDVPLDNYDIRESLQRELLVTSYLHSRTYLTLLNMKRYLSVIEPIMKEYGVPEDFKYLCMAESGLDPNVMSSASAGGLWQIMSATGRSYGLDVGTEVDERYHIEKSTVAACKYLLNSYNIFGSWTLTAAAYNLGDTGVRRRLEAQGVTDYYDSFFPDETQRYLFRILSLKLISQNPLQYGYDIAAKDYYLPLTNYREVEISEKTIDWSEVAQRYGTTYKMLRQLNHWIRDYKFNNRTGKSYVLKIPNAGFRSTGVGVGVQ